MQEGFVRNKPKPDQSIHDEERPLQAKSDLDTSQFNRTMDTNRNLIANQNSSGKPLTTFKPLPNVLQSSPTPGAGYNTTHSSFIKDGIIWTSFSLSDRLNVSTKNLITCKPRFTYVDQLKTSPHFPTKEEISKLQGHILKLTIQETSQLELDPNIMHPFVKMHFVNMNSGQYLQKHILKPIMSPEERITRIDGAQNYSTEDMNFIPPFATKCCDLRTAGNARAKWNETILMDEEAPNLFHEDSIILFEVLDYNKELLKENSKLLDVNLNYRIAWGYLRPCGIAKNHLGLSKIQLYKYKFRPTTISAKYLKNQYKRVPHVYFDFIWPEKKPYDGYLTVQLNAIDPPQYIRVMENAQNIFEVEEDVEDVTMNMTKYKSKNKELTKAELDDPEYIKQQKELLKMAHFPHTECRIPDEILFRFQSADLGCFRLAFSPNGKYLAAACTSQNSKTVIKIFNVEDGVLKYTIKAHKNIVHDLEFTSNNLHLMTCSSDFTTKIWKIPYPELVDEIEEDDSEKYMHLCTFLHPSYVYSSKFFPDNDEGKMIIATASFDSKVRFWRVDFEYGRYARHDLISDHVVSYDGNQPDKFTNLLEHRHPNTLKFDNQGRLYIGDSMGCVHVWDIQLRYQKLTVTKIRILEHSELSRDAINSVSLLPVERKRVLVHSRDNCIRNIDYSMANSLRIVGRFFGSKSSKYPIRSVVSPDGQYLLSGSENGKIFLWDLTTSDLIPTDHLGISFMGPVADVAWSESYHMIAVGGFGDEYPILVFASKKHSEHDMDRVLDHLKGMEEEKSKIIHTDAEEHQIKPKKNDESFGRTNTGQFGERRLE